MSQFPGHSGLIFNEPLLWEKGKPGRQGMSLPRRDVEPAEPAAELVRTDLNFPDLSEVDVIRHYTRLSQWNFGVDSGMYPLGSCTMKYNPKINEYLAALPAFAEAHPCLPDEMVQGPLQLMHELERHLVEITGLDAATLQPTAGAHGELTGMLVIHAYHRSRGKARFKIIIPDTAHGTNPASAALCDFAPVKIESNEQGIISAETVARVMDEDTAGIMITNPNTLGLFEENIRQIAEIVHAKGGLVYCDGANMNALMGVGHIGRMGVDVLHLNLHKTFSTPHGGGGPGAGPVCVTKDLARFLPAPRVVKDGDLYRFSGDFPDSVGRLHAFHGNFGVLLKAYAYILSLGPELKKASQLAVLNANYIKEHLKSVLPLAYDRPCMHECVFSDADLKPFKITTLDLAKRLMDYGFHPPTIYFPLVVAGAIMIEPTETESRETLDSFIEAVKTVVKEAETDPDRLHAAPVRSKVSRLDETAAARNPCLVG